MESAVSVRDLSKTYRVYSRPWHRLAEALIGRTLHQPFHALCQVSFELPHGESLGIVGENGAGKSTLLRILAGVSSPSAGHVEVRGRISSILELGAGFHPEFTGRQNIRINAALLGLSEERVEATTPDIIAFSELGEFIDRPVKTYSTGMAMRLAFAIAAQVDPEVLIVDEALSVGDGYFQKKCMDRMVELVSSGTTLLFCTHAMYYLSAFCEHALWLRGGRIEALGPAREVVQAYEAFLQQRAALGRSGGDEALRPRADGERPGRLTRIALPLRAAGRHRHGDSFRLEIEWAADRSELLFHVGVGIDRADGVQIASMSTHREGLEPFRGGLHYGVALEIPSLPMVQGSYTLYVYLLDEAGLHVYDQAILEEAFRVEYEVYRPGMLHIAHRWTPLEPTAAPMPASVPVGSSIASWK